MQDRSALIGADHCKSWIGHPKVVTPLRARSLARFGWRTLFLILFTPRLEHLAGQRQQPPPRIWPSRENRRFKALIGSCLAHQNPVLTGSRSRDARSYFRNPASSITRTAVPAARRHSPRTYGEMRLRPIRRRPRMACCRHGPVSMIEECEAALEHLKILQ